MNTAKSYDAEFISPGAVGYPEDGETCYIRDSVLAKMANTMIGKPVYFTHEGRHPIGHVADVYKKDNGNYSALLTIHSDKAIECLDKDWGFSCTYLITDYKKNVNINAVPYQREILDGVFDHLAVVKNPRFNELSFFKKNSLEGGDIIKMNIFKKNSVTKKEEVREEDKYFTLIDGNKVLVKDLADFYRNKKKNEAYMVPHSEVVNVDGEDVLISDLINLYKENGVKEVNEATEETASESTTDSEVKDNEIVEKRKLTFLDINKKMNTLPKTRPKLYFTESEQEKLGKTRY